MVFPFLFILPAHISLILQLYASPLASNMVLSFHQPTKQQIKFGLICKELLSFRLSDSIYKLPATLRDDKAKTIEYCFHRRNSSKTRRITSRALGSAKLVNYACLRTAEHGLVRQKKKAPSFRLSASIYK